MKDYTPVPSLPDDKLLSWWENGRNVLVVGDHGIGKTTIIKNFWDKLGIKYAMFSGATLDPWTDLVGIPRPIERGDEMFIEYVRPQTIPDDIEAIYIDEINRSHPKVRNALLELIQFKSINGKVFPKLRVVWAAANPPDTEYNYDVEEMDPAQEDRFHVIVKLDYAASYEYFESKYGAALADSAVSWWNKQDKEVQSVISPRRLDYVVEHFLDNGDLRDVIPYNCVNVSSLRRALKENRALDEFVEIFEQHDEEKAKKFFSDAKKWQDVRRDVLERFEWANFAIQYMDAETVASVACNDTKFATLLAHHQKTNKHLRSAVEEIQKSGANVDWLTTALLADKELALTKELSELFNNINEGIMDKASQVPNISKRLSLDSAEDIIEDMDLGVSDPFPLFDVESAENVLKFLEKAWAGKSLEHVSESSLSRLAGGAVYSLYENAGNLLGASYVSSVKFLSNFAIPHIQKLVKVQVRSGRGNLAAPAGRASRSRFRGRSRTNVKPAEL